MTQCQSVSTFESELRNSLSAFEPHSMDSLGHQQHVKKLSPKIALHFKVLCESKATLPLAGFGAQLTLLSKILQDLFYLPMSMFKFSNVSPQTYENGLLLPL